MAGLVPGHDPGGLVQFGLVVREVHERDAGEQLVDPLLQHPPDRPDAARRVPTTSLGVDRMEIAVDFEGDVLRRLDHIFDTDGLRVARQVVAAFGATHRVDQSRAPQAQQDLLDVVVRQALQLGQLARRDRSLPCPLREVQGDDQTVLGPGSDAHTINMRQEVTGFNGQQGPYRRRGRQGDAVPPWPPLPPYLTSRPTSRPATLMRTSQDQHVAVFNRRTLSYQTLPPMVAGAMVTSQSIVPNSMPASGPPPCTHSPPRSRP